LKKTQKPAAAANTAAGAEPRRAAPPSGTVEVWVPAAAVVEEGVWAEVEDGAVEEGDDVTEVLLPLVDAVVFVDELGAEEDAEVDAEVGAELVTAVDEVLAALELAAEELGGAVPLNWNWGL